MHILSEVKKIVVMPVKNEQWILEKSLSAASLWADHIIVADQNSTDKTYEICKKFSKVIWIKNSSVNFNEGQRRQMLLEAARNFGDNNLIFALDADEIVSAQILETKVNNSLFSQILPGMSVQFEWINLWRGVLNYRDDGSVWSKSYKAFAYYDDGKMSFLNGDIHLSRVPESSIKNTIKFSPIKIFHFQFVDFERMLAKQRYYRVLERVLNPNKSALAINHRYKASKDERGIMLSPVPKQWTDGYVKNGIDLKNFEKSNFFWQEAEVLNFFKIYGIKKFANLDIWDIDWESKRQRAKKLNLQNLPTEPIVDPRNFLQKSYHQML